MDASTSGFVDLVNSLIEMKAKRDNGFSPGRLCSEIGINRSILKRILSGEVTNPRLDTIQKICQYFHNDGFPINIEEIVTNSKKSINKIGVPLFMSGSCEKNIGAIEMDSISNGSSNMLAVLAENDISSMAKKGSVFIVNMDIAPKKDHLLAVKDKSTNIISFVYAINDDVSLITSIDKAQTPIELPQNYEVLGVVVKINAEL